MRPVALKETVRDLDGPVIDWDDLRFFRAAIEEGSLRKAALALGTNTATVSRRIRSLESALGGALTITSRRGIRLTDLGADVYERAGEMGSSIASLARRARSAAGPQIAGRVRISITEGLGAYWLLPRMVEFQRAHPTIMVEATCSMEPANPLNHETDLSVQLYRPTDGELIATRLGTMHVTFFASRSYAERFGLPQSPGDFLNHKILTQGSPQVQENGLMRGLGVSKPEGVVSFRTNTSSAHFELLRRGAGIGGLPSYAACVDPTLIPIEFKGMRTMLEIWMAYHKDAKNIASVAAVIDWVQGSFDKKRFPFFRDEYVPAAKIAALPDEDWKINRIAF